MQQGGTVFYGMPDDLAASINQRHDLHLYAEPGRRRPALVVEALSRVKPPGSSANTVDLTVFLSTGRTWLVRGVPEGSPGSPGTWWPRA